VFITDQASLLRKSDSGENHLLLVFFLREEGLKSALARKRSKASAGQTIPDMFETGELILEQKDPSKPAFLKDFSSVRQYSQIALRYQRLKNASSLTRFYERNLIHMEHFTSAWELLHGSLEAFSQKDPSELVLFKALFLFARMEGYPVSQHWLDQLNKDDSSKIRIVLQQPVEECTESISQLNNWLQSLYTYFQQDTDLLPPDL
jgi:recombinational DNA repair protein (RecF pathway)